MKKKDLLNKSREELEKLEEKFKEERRDIYFSRVLSSMRNPVRIREVRRKIALLKTILNEYRLGIRK